MRMKLGKKLFVWCAFLVLGLIITGCEEEEAYFDSAVEVEDTNSGSGTVGNVHVTKTDSDENLLDLILGEEEQVADVDDDAALAEVDFEGPSEYEAEDESEELGESAGSSDATTASVVTEPEKKEETVPEKEPEEEKEPAAEKEPEVEKEPEPEKEPEVVKEPEADPEPEVVEETVAAEEPDEETPQVVEKAEESVDIGITILIVNRTGINFGMVAVIDPYSGEQLHIGSLGNDEMFILETLWPTGQKHFNLGVYDGAGNLIKQDAVDFKGITAGGVITLTGSGKLSKVESEIE